MELHKLVSSLRDPKEILEEEGIQEYQCFLEELVYLSTFHKGGFQYPVGDALELFVNELAKEVTTWKDVDYHVHADDPSKSYSRDRVKDLGASIRTSCRVPGLKLSRLRDMLTYCIDMYEQVLPEEIFTKCVSDTKP